MQRQNRRNFEQLGASQFYVSPLDFSIFLYDKEVASSQIIKRCIHCKGDQNSKPGQTKCSLCHKTRKHQSAAHQSVWKIKFMKHASVQTILSKPWHAFCTLLVTRDWLCVNDRHTNQMGPFHVLPNHILGYMSSVNSKITMPASINELHCINP